MIQNPKILFFQGRSKELPHRRLWPLVPSARGQAMTRSRHDATPWRRYLSAFHEEPPGTTAGTPVASSAAGQTLLPDDPPLRPIAGCSLPGGCCCSYTPVMKYEPQTEPEPVHTV